ncbi:MAG: hypothetical protein ACYCYP_04040 [Leptospirales bacterium]
MPQSFVVHRFLSGVLILIVLLGTGCQATGTGYLSPNTNLSRLKVVVVPFTNLTTTPDAGKSVTSIFLSEIQIRNPFSLLPLPKETLSGVNPSVFGDSIPNNVRIRLQAQTGADAVLTGVVTEFEYRIGGTTRPVAGFAWSLVSLHTGRTLWAANASRMGSCFWSCRQTLSGMARDLIDEKLQALGGH